MSYKAEKEASIINLHGMTMSEVMLLLSILPISVWFHTEVRSRYKTSSYIFDIILTLFPLVLGIVCLDYIVIVHIIFIGLSFSSYLFRRHNQTTTLRQQHIANETRPEYVTVFRALMVSTTCLAILAVDFPVFPRRLAKTETFGVSLMDIGVGAYMMSMALTSKNARGKKQQSTLEMMISNGVTLLMGFFRLWTVKAVEYQEHVTEYGVHWNFYFTLVSVSIVIQIIEVWKPKWISTLSACLILAMYQLYLSAYEGTEYIMNAPRDTFINQNREGIYSWIGYIALYMIAVDISRHFVFSTKKRNIQSKLWRWIALQLVLWSLTWTSSVYIQPASRRMVNITYVLWVLAQTTQILALLFAVQCISPTYRISTRVLEGIGQHQLSVFIIANVCTGIINLSIYTLHYTTIVSVPILLFYLIVVAYVPLLADWFGERFKK